MKLKMIVVCGESLGRFCTDIRNEKLEIKVEQRISKAISLGYSLVYTYSISNPYAFILGAQVVLNIKRKVFFMCYDVCPNYMKSDMVQKMITKTKDTNIDLYFDIKKLKERLLEQESTYTDRCISWLKSYIPFNNENSNVISFKESSSLDISSLDTTSLSRFQEYGESGFNGLCSSLSNMYVSSRDYFNEKAIQYMIKETKNENTISTISTIEKIGEIGEIDYLYKNKERTDEIIYEIERMEDTDELIIEEEKMEEIEEMEEMEEDIDKPIRIDEID